MGVLLCLVNLLQIQPKDWPGWFTYVLIVLITFLVLKITNTRIHHSLGEEKEEEEEEEEEEDVVEEDQNSTLEEGGGGRRDSGSIGMLLMKFNASHMCWLAFPYTNLCNSFSLTHSLPLSLSLS